MKPAKARESSSSKWKGVHRVAGILSLHRVRAGAMAAFVMCFGTGMSAVNPAQVFAAKATPTPVTRTSSGDIPDTATYLRYRGKAYSIEYVEGWVQARLTGDGVRMSDI